MGKPPRWLTPLDIGQALPSAHFMVWAALLLVTMSLEEASSYEPCLSELKGRVIYCPGLPNAKAFPQNTDLQLCNCTVSGPPYSCSVWHLSAWGAYTAHMGGAKSSPAHLWVSNSVFIDSTANLSWWNLWCLFLAAIAPSDSTVVNWAVSPNYRASLDYGLPELWMCLSFEPQLAQSALQPPSATGHYDSHLSNCLGNWPANSFSSIPHIWDHVSGCVCLNKPSGHISSAAATSCWEGFSMRNFLPEF